MNDPLIPLVAAYAEVEHRARNLMTGRCAEHCRACRRVCCRLEYCRESLESPFLQRVSGHNRIAPAEWHPQRGWLGDRGCTLPAGRPPVCYAFYCETIMAAQPGPFDRYALAVLARLMDYIGRRARGSRHLVELSDLSSLNLPRISRQLQTARTVVEQLAHYWSTGQARSSPLWDKICPQSSLSRP